MRARISEKNLAAGFIFFTIGFIILLNAKVFPSPTRISEKGLLYCVFAFIMMAFCVHLLRLSVQ
jgi:hypothetical protein